MARTEYNSIWSLDSATKSGLIESIEFRELLMAAIDEVVSSTISPAENNNFYCSPASYEGLSEDEFEGHNPNLEDCTCGRCANNPDFCKLDFVRLWSIEGYRVNRLPPEPPCDTRAPEFLLKLPLFVKGKYAICVSIQDSVQRGELLELYNQLVQMRTAVKAGWQVQCHFVLFTMGTCLPVRKMRQHLSRVVPMNGYVKRWSARWDGGSALVAALNLISIVDMSLAPKDIDKCVTALDKFVYCLMTNDLEKRQSQWSLIDRIKRLTNTPLVENAGGS